MDTELEEGLRKDIAVDRNGEKDSLLEGQHNENVYLEKQEARAVWLREGTGAAPSRG